MGDKLIFIRHAAVQIEPVIPSREWRLSDNGRSLAHNLVQKIAAYNPTHIITSAEPKAIETGQIIAEELTLTCQTAPNLHEHERSKTQYFESKEEFVTAVTHFFNHPDKLVFGDETASQALKRFDTAVHQIITAYPSDTLTIVSHGTVMALFLSHYNQFNPVPFWQNLKMPDFFVVTLPNFTFHDSRFTL